MRLLSEITRRLAKYLSFLRSRPEISNREMATGKHRVTVRWGPSRNLTWVRDKRHSDEGDATHFLCKKRRLLVFDDTYGGCLPSGTHLILRGVDKTKHSAAPAPPPAACLLVLVVCDYQ